ncbi:hypothetical protein VMCG_09719 [Cytospora schulzeri]|uniref:Uncharacterized protein n=1 Tax=Cytospora schulzeri TaxID=448051 RepID=A0A423VHE5_9PEZI|nr:hypothetical protein VMCG_09719 [Valsa malicola]
MDHLDTNEKAPEAGNMDGAGIHGPQGDFEGRHMDDKSSYQASTQPPSTPSSQGKEDTNDPDHKINLERDRLGLPHINRKETPLAPKNPSPWDHLGITLGGPMVLIFDIIVPCIIYYVWYHNHRATYERDCAEFYPGLPLSTCPIDAPEFDKDVLGSAIASFGIGELWILLGRVHRLYVHHEDCAPLLSTNKWELDATSWVYAVAMIVALVPFLVGSSLVMPKLYLYGPSFIMGFLGLLMVISVLPPFPVPVRLSSMPRWAPMRPFIYYAAEDFLAVDGLQDREFRLRYNDRYESNPMFRRFLYNLTLWWALGVCVYIGSVSAVIWTLEFHDAFGLSLGVLFSYIAIWAVVTYVWTGMEMQREHEAYERGDFEV